MYYSKSNILCLRQFLNRKLLQGVSEQHFRTKPINRTYQATADEKLLLSLCKCIREKIFSYNSVYHVCNLILVDANIIGLVFIFTVSGYEFGVSNNVSVNSLVELPSEAIVGNISSLLVTAGTSLTLQINASKFTFV